tara:strand:- start:513 stop:1133 length:621 start_codon:yes stop_codon:yes gene_type:complete
MNHFTNANVRWKTWSPENVIFKSNQLVKKVLPSEHIMSWKSKGDRDRKMCEKTGCKAVQHSPYANGKPYTYYTKDNYKGIMVQLTDVKSDFPSANIDFIDWTERKDSVGNQKGALDILVYLNSFHSTIQWGKCPNTGQWIKKNTGQVAPLREGYRMCYGGQGDANSLDFDEFHELVQITEMIRDFLVDVIVPAKNGELVEEDLLVA